MELNTQRRAAGLKEKLPEMQKSLDTVQFLKTQQSVHTHTSPQPHPPLDTFYLLSSKFLLLPQSCPHPVTLLTSDPPSQTKGRFRTLPNHVLAQRHAVRQSQCTAHGRGLPVARRQRHARVPARRGRGDAAVQTGGRVQHPGTLRGRSGLSEGADHGAFFFFSVYSFSLFLQVPFSTRHAQSLNRS